MPQISHVIVVLFQPNFEHCPLTQSWILKASRNEILDGTLHWIFLDHLRKFPNQIIKPAIALFLKILLNRFSKLPIFRTLIRDWDRLKLEIVRKDLFLRKFIFTDMPSDFWGVTKFLLKKMISIPKIINYIIVKCCSLIILGNTAVKDFQLAFF